MLLVVLITFRYDYKFQIFLATQINVLEYIFRGFNFKNCWNLVFAIGISV